MAADKKFYNHVKAFLLSHQIGDDPNRNLARIKVLANTNPDRWDGKLPTRGIRPDESYCKVAEATASRPIMPWWWYAADREPVPSVVAEIYKRLTFDFTVVYPQENAWMYVNVEPSPGVLNLLSRQEHLKAFILVSLVNKKFPRAQREHKRLRLGTVMGSKDLRKIFTFVAFREDDQRYRSLPANIPTISRLVHTASNTANWSIRLPGDGHVYGSLLEVLTRR
jgi:hypothetical protein